MQRSRGGNLFPVEQVDPDWRCRLGLVVNGYTTVGVIGPVQTPIAEGFYEYLLDRPMVIASLVQRLGIANFQASARGPNQFWFNDGDGTQGLLTLVRDDQTARIYHQLCVMIAQDPDRVAQEATSPPLLASDELEWLKTQLHAMRHPIPSPQPLRPAP